MRWHNDILNILYTVIYVCIVEVQVSVLQADQTKAGGGPAKPTLQRQSLDEMLWINWLLNDESVDLTGEDRVKMTFAWHLLSMISTGGLFTCLYQMGTEKKFTIRSRP